jgi:hypothetical protein
MYKYILACFLLISCGSENTPGNKTKEEKISFDKISNWHAGRNGLRTSISTAYFKLDANGRSIGILDIPISQTIDSFDKQGYLVRRTVHVFSLESKPERSDHITIERTLDSVLTEIEYDEDTFFMKYVATPTGRSTYTAEYYLPYNGGLFHSRTGYFTLNEQYKLLKAKVLDYKLSDTVVTNLSFEYPNSDFSIAKTIVMKK